MTRKKKEEKEPQKIPMYDFQGEKVVEIETKRLRSFVGHPYKVLDGLPCKGERPFLRR